MFKYVDIVLLSNGQFVMAPPWSMAVGDLVVLPDISGMPKVEAVTTENVDNDIIKMLEKLYGAPLRKVTEKYKCYPVKWEDEEDEHTGQAE